LVLYEIRVSEEESFELVGDEPLKVGELITEGSTVYEVTRLREGHDHFDGVAEVEWRAGPDPPESD
jgi:hypothetical protein